MLNKQSSNQIKPDTSLHEPIKEKVNKLPIYPNFKPVGPEDKEIINSYTLQFPPYSDFIFSNLMHWGNGESKSQYSFLNNNLVIRILDNFGKEIIYSLLGQSQIQESINQMIKDGCLLQYIPEHTIKQMRDLDLYEVSEDRGSFDYIFNIKDIAELTGSHLKKRRKEISRFQKKYDDILIKEVKTVTAIEKKEIIQLVTEWKNLKETDNSLEISSIEYEHQSIINFLDHIHNHETLILLAYKKDKLVGFSINEIINHEIILKNFAKADKNFDGLSAALLHASSKILHDRGFKIMNNEPDLNIKGLREKKLSWKPIYLLKKYSIKFKNPHI